MDWQSVKSVIIGAVGSCLEPLGYKFVKSRDGFELSSAGERRGVYILAVSTHHGNRILSVWCGIKNNLIEERFHRTSGVDKKHHAGYTTLNISSEKNRALDTEDEVLVAASQVKEFVTKVAIPFLTKNYSMDDYSNLLNANPKEKCSHHGNRENRCHYGLIAAKMAGDSRYEELKEVYSDFLKNTNKGFYFPRFERLVKDLETPGSP